jgi:hypothetical protein
VVPSLDYGATFSALGVTARRNAVAVVPDVDSATSTCSFTLGAAVDPVVPEVPMPGLLVVAGAALTAGSVAMRRRRTRRAA